MFRKYYEEIINYLLKGFFWAGATDAEKAIIRKRASKYKVINGVLYHKGKGRGIEDLRLVATTAADQHNAIRMCHVSELDEQHFGINKTASLLACKYYWRMMYTDVIKYIEKCPNCLDQGKTVPPVVPVIPEPAPQIERNSVWRMLEVEILERFFTSGKKVHHFLRLVDVNTNWTSFLILEEASERAAIRALFQECSILGFPLAFRFVRDSEECSWANSFVSAIHQEVDGFPAAWGVHGLDTSVHVALEPEYPEWQLEQCLHGIQQVVVSNQAALYVFFGKHSLVEKSVQDWHVQQVQQFMKDQPFWWPQRLPSFLFHLRHSLPPGMTTSPATMLQEGDKGDSNLFLPIKICPPPEEKDIPLVGKPCGKEFLVQSSFRTRPEKEKATESSQELPPTDSTPATSDKSLSAKRKPEIAKPSSGAVSVNSGKRTHLSNKSKYHSSTRTEEEVQAGYTDALNMAISRGMKEVEMEKEKKKKLKKNGKKNNSSSDLFCIKGVLPSTNSSPQEKLGPGGIQGSMSSLEALKAVTSGSVPRNVPNSPMLPSTLQSPSTPDEEASPGRYSFRQNLKAKGPSNYIKRLMAKTSSKRFTAGHSDVIAEPELKWPSPPHPPSPSEKEPVYTEPKPVLPKAPSKNSIHKSNKLNKLLSLVPNSVSPNISATVEPTTCKLFDTSLDTSSLAISANLDPSSLEACDDLEPTCSLGLSQAEEELIDQTIKGVDQNEFMDPDKIGGVDVDDITKVDLSSMDISITSSGAVDELHNSDDLNGSKTSMDVSESGLFESDIPRCATNEIERTLLNSFTDPKHNNVTNTDIIYSTDLNSQNEIGSAQEDLKISYSDDEDRVNEAEQEPASDIAMAVKRSGNINFYDDTSNHLNLSEDSSEDEAAGEVLETAEQSENQNFATEHFNAVVEEKDGSDNGEVSETYVSENYVGEVDETNILEEETVREATSAVIFDVLDTCANFEVDDGCVSEQVVESIDICDNAEGDQLELVKDKISRDLACGLTIDKTKSVVVPETELDPSTLEQKLASACDALLTMASHATYSNSETTTGQDQLQAGRTQSKLESMQSELSTQEELERIKAESVTRDELEKIQAKSASLYSSHLDLFQTLKVDSNENASYQITSEPTCMLQETVPLPEEKLVEDECDANGEENESELCLPIDFFIDEDDLTEAPQKVKPLQRPSREAVTTQPKLTAEQDIVTILNSIMNNRAFLDDPITRAHREGLDRSYKRRYGLKKEVRIKVQPLSEDVARRALTGPVPVRTIRNNDRRSYYVGTLKIHEFKAPASAMSALTVKPPLPKTHSSGIILSTKGMTTVPVIKKLQVISRPHSPKEVIKQDSGVKPSPLDLNPLLLRKPGGKPLGCPICPRTYAISQEMLDLHVTFHIDNARNLHCPICGKSGNTWTNILKHYLGHPEVKENASVYEMILATCSKDRNTCGQCNTTFAMRTALLQHLKTNHVGEKVNRVNNVHFVSEEVRPEKELFQTEETNNSESKSNSLLDVNYLCPNCPYSTKTHYNLVLHSHECQGNGEKIEDPLKGILDDLCTQFKCSLCGFNGISSKQLEQHMRLQHGGGATFNKVKATQECKHACDFCPMKFRTMSLLHSHLTKHKEDSMFQCKVCKYKCRYKKIMHRHVNKMHPNVPLKGTVQAPKKLKKPFISPMVKQRFKPGKKNLAESDPDFKDERQDEDKEEDYEEDIPEATVVVHTDENGELTVCEEEEENSSLPMETEETTFLLDSSTLDGNSVTLDGNVIQILQGEGGVDCNGQPKMLFLSVGPQELENFSAANTFTIAEQDSRS